MIKEKKKQKGFTLVETLVAVTLMTFAIAGPLTLASRSLAAANFSRDQIAAFYLAQEAVELVRNKRDTNAISGNSWVTGLSTCIDTPCILDGTISNINSGSLTTSCIGECPPLRQNQSNNLFGYDPAWPISKFTREVIITNINSSEIKVGVTISWTTGALSRTFTITEHFLDWQ